jgi:hypothetical protein
VKPEEDDCSGGICACFAVRKKKKTEVPMQSNESNEPKINQRLQQPRIVSTPIVDYPIDRQ